MTLPDWAVFQELQRASQLELPHEQRLLLRLRVAFHLAVTESLI